MDASRAETAGQLQQQAAAFHCRARPLSWSLAGSDLESNADQTTDWVTNAGKLACSLAQDADGALGRVPSLGPSVKCPVRTHVQGAHSQPQHMGYITSYLTLSFL